MAIVTRVRYATALLLLPLAIGATGGASGADSTTTTTTTATTTATTTTSTTSPTTTTTTPITSPANERDPFNAPVLARYLRGRQGIVTAAVYDVKSGRTYLYDGGVRERTASIVKIDILADLLYEDQVEDRAMTKRQVALATAMIEDSDDSDATKLWSLIGGRDAIDAFNEMIGFRQTIPSWSWGDIETTPRDQLHLLKVITLPNRYLNSDSRSFEMGLMEGTIESERFGLGWGSPARALVGVKDGYYPEATTGWQLNTTGFVRYQGRFYLATIMTAHNPNEEYGIGTVTAVASDIWKYLKP